MQQSISRVHGRWASFVGEWYRLADSEFRLEVYDYACICMRTAREHICRLIEYLHSTGYNFAGEFEIYEEPTSDAHEWIRDAEERGIYLPISMQAWLTQVGTVDLRGSHSDWDTSAYIIDNTQAPQAVWFTDPLVVLATTDYIDYLYDEWIDNGDDDSQEEPFMVEFSPDHLTKANVSGGAPYSVLADSPAVDRLVLNQRECISFFGYIRMSIEWGGFPGFRYIGHLPSNVAKLKIDEIAF